MNTVAIKRIYGEPSDKDGYRMLVDRLWPKGVSKEEAKLDEWNKDIAPSTELRKWFDHQEERFAEFTKRYQDELDLKRTEIERLQTIAKKHQLTLLYSAKNLECNQAVVLCNYLNKK
jgi:uncharacterized protein YeaO (DUF488 family)